jgi:hypothetical protein
MLVRIGLENGIGKRSLAWALDHPGCFAYGEDGSSAIIAMAQAIPAYIAWLESHTPNPWFNPVDIDIRLVDVWDGYQIDDTYLHVQDGREVNAWFQTDWVPLTESEADHGLEILDWSRSDLISSLAFLSPAQLDMRLSGEALSIRERLFHIASMENWYLERLVNPGLKNDNLIPEDTFDRLYFIRDQLKLGIKAMTGEERVIGIEGEFWSPRKLLRRAAGCEIDQINQIQRLRSLL